MAIWRAELAWLAFYLALSFVVGLLIHQLLLGLSCGLLICLLRELYYLRRLLSWLHGTGKPPPANGAWEEVYYQIYQIKRRGKRRKKRLLRWLSHFRSATSALPDATVVLGPHDEIEWFNTTAERILGLTKGDVGKLLVNLVRYPAFTHYMRGGNYNHTVDLPSPKIDGMLLEARIVRYGEGLRLLVMRDITQLRFMERVRSDFVANVSHELKTPLTVLKGYLETLHEAQHEIPERFLKIIMRMDEQSGRMQNLINGLLSLTKLESNGFSLPHKPVAMGPLLHDIVEEMQWLDEDQPTIELRLETEDDILGNEQELRSAFTNLVVNAVKYTRANGNIIIRWYREQDGACLCVQDDGMGISPEHIPRLTERFYRVEVEGARGKSGAGLGLAIVKHVLSRHEAELKIHSLLNQGSRFCCYFPARKLLPAQNRIS